MKRSSKRKSGKTEEADSETEEIAQNGGTTSEETQNNRSGRPGRKSKSKQPAASEDGSESVGSEIDEPKPIKKKKSKKNDDTEKQNDAQDEDSEEGGQYEVEAVLDEKKIKGVIHYLIRWKGYTEESDTWEPEHTLDCNELIAEFNKNHQNKKQKGKKVLKKNVKNDKPQDWDENEDFEVGRILEVHFRRDGKREFLISWKGYPSSEDSWEPEENLDCKDLIEKFMAKVEQAKNVGVRELRIHKPSVQRLTLQMHETDRRLSKRIRGKERVHYNDMDSD